MPVILILVIIGLLAGLIIYQHMTLYSLASRMADKIAYSWDNSYKEIETGAFEFGRRDGLYWRVTSDRAFPMVTGELFEPLVLKIPAYPEPERPSLAERKLLRGSDLLPTGIDGEIRFANTFVEKAIAVKLRRPLRLPYWLHALFGFELHVQAVRTISDPAEYIRGIDLIRTYSGIAKDTYEPHEAKALFREPVPDGDAADVNSHEEAARWVRMETGGIQTSYSTSYGVRMIDSLASGNTAHQAFFTYRESQVIIQADKDAELLQGGVLDKVVWHFFRGAGNRQPLPSENLLTELRSRGIQVIIHPGGEADA